ncbi:SPOSA6832_00784 [Sporobolomyces salmonicolor]|uniref:SPOSA6832_00784-mRNA-1:cds n=1 Tax=Sporidiobolus salmonicolor TaxID=5005 RepID=A0A0D6EH72_SPOSA|nr:SPOSA6832_00784 [Sporobolomyces salmonicolor]
MSDSSLSPSFYRALTSRGGPYNLILGTVLGSSLWHSFIGGTTAYGTLPRQQFGNLQARLFPKFFALQSAASLALLDFYRRSGRLSRDDKNVWLLGAMAIAGVVNWLVVGPWTSGKWRRRACDQATKAQEGSITDLDVAHVHDIRVMKKRHRRERIEGKAYSDADVSPEMKSLNKRFGILHGVSSLLNLGFIGSCIAHAAYVGAYGAP